MKDDKQLSELRKTFEALLKTLGVEKADSSAIHYLKKFENIAFLGEIGPLGIGVPDLFNLIGQNRMTGILTFELEKATKILIFKNGEIVSTISNQKDELFGEWLCGRGKITPGQLKSALEEQNRSGGKLGKILVDMGFLTPRELLNLSLIRAKEIIYNLFRLLKGKFFFIRGEIDWPMVVEIPGLKVQGLILEGIKRLDDWNRFIKIIPSADVVLRKKKWLTENLPKETIHQQILDLLKQGPLKMSEICKKAQRGEFETYKIISELVQRNFIEIQIEEEIIIE